MFSLLLLGSAHAQTLTLPGPITVEISGISGTVQTQLQQQLQQNLTPDLQQQWALLTDEQYWPTAQLFASTGQWPAHAALLQQAWQQCEAWWQQQHSYHCRFGAARKVWREASATAVPDRVKLRREARQLLDQAGTALRPLPDLQGFAQAVLLDDVLNKVRSTVHTRWPQASLHLRFGHWQAQFGPAALEVTAFAGAMQNPLTAIRLQQQVLLQANGSAAAGSKSPATDAVWYPTEAWPVQYGPAVAVTSQNFSRAWLLAQALAAAPPAARTQSLPQQTDAALWHEWQQDPTATPQFQASKNWFGQLQAAAAYQQPQHLQLQLELPVQPLQAKRPYVSAWLSQHGQWQAQLLLLGEQPRWYPELRSWWRQAGSNASPGFDQLAGATRRAGVHQFQWDARLADGRPLPAGDYTLHLEAAREGGGREQLKLPLHWPLQQPLLLQGQRELGQIRVEARRADHLAVQPVNQPTTRVSPSG